MTTPSASPADPQQNEHALATTAPTETGEKTATATATTTTTATTTATVNAPSADQAQAQSQQPKQANRDDDDDESDLDELDDVLDDFKPKPTPAPAPNVASQPAAPSSTDVAEAFDEEAFMKQLEKDMANMMDHATKESGTSDNQGFEDAVNQGADAFTKQLEESGIPPGDFLKQLLADVMAEDAGAGSDAGAAAAAAAAASSGAGSGAGSSSGAPAPESFNDAIQQTINRMKESGDKATAAASEDDISDDLVAQLLKAMEAGAGAGDDGDLTKMFMGMMEQLSNKEMLYEPMKELDGKFGPWLVENKGKGTVSEEDMERYENQASIVSQIVAKFEEKGYTDEDPKCREYVWEKMQAMQAAGNPPEELIANPFGDELKGPGASGVPDCPQQ
ncbi:Pex19 protein family-domain-containing protein [Aspergillus leporis]|uniref:Pex19 protein family-domain-containing protein n=1 Tax=Aspergillus leporis TaxID=41062 RepID=A0A5N5WSV7_9EURO|nr:Pex19 protein family-domain-containing protein [Aspergillus leporis]